MPRMSQLVFAAVLCVATAGMVAPASAQDRLIERNRWLGAYGRFGQDLGPAPDIRGVSFVGGDEFGVKDGVAYHVPTGATAHLGDGRPVAFDGARPRVFMARPDGIWQVLVGATAPGQPLATRATLFAAGPTADLTECRHAASADVLVCLASRGPDTHDFVRIDASGRHLLFTDNVSPGWAPTGWAEGAFVLTTDAARIYFPRCVVRAFDCLQADLVGVDVATGATAVADRSVFGFLTGFFFDELNERMFAFSNQTVWVFDRDLTLLGSAIVGGRCRQLAVSPHTGRLYVNTMDYLYDSEWSTLTAFESTTYRRLEPDVIRSADLSCGPLKVLTAPGRPRAVRATVTGHTVSLRWTNIGDASRFLLEAGLTPGRTDLRIGLGADAHTTVTDVPTGTYYVRIRGGNVHGGGHASDEVRIVVP